MKADGVPIKKQVAGISCGLVTRDRDSCQWWRPHL